MSPSTVSIDEISFVGRGLHRPECVLATARGDLFTSDWRGGVTWIRPDGTQRSITAARENGLPEDGLPVRPNGIAIAPNGTFLLADLGERGGVWRLYPDGALDTFLVEIDGRRLPPTNFVHVDAVGRTWITVSTQVTPRADDYRPGASSGFIAVIDATGARIAAEGLGYANECAVDPSGRFLYVNETFARRLSRFPILPGSRLGDRETVASFGAGIFPDGLAFDAEGGVWIASIVSNTILRVGPDGSQTVVLEDADQAHVEWVEQAFSEGRMDRPHLDTMSSRLLQSTSSIAFGGPDLRTAYVGCLLGDRVASFPAPVAGCPPSHWHFDASVLTPS